MPPLAIRGVPTDSAPPLSLVFLVGVLVLVPGEVLSALVLSALVLSALVLLVPPQSLLPLLLLLPLLMLLAALLA
jgi:hypothetical protein